MEKNSYFRRNHWFVALGIAWTVIFAGMSFYWAMGGMLGVRSLGGAIYEMSINPEPSFIAVVWLTGVIKLIGVVLLLLLFVRWGNDVIAKILYFLTKTAGVFLFLYGLLNFITISMSVFDILDFDLDSYATCWRLTFWEPFWMVGGVCYFFAVKR